MYCLYFERYVVHMHIFNILFILDPKAFDHDILEDLSSRTNTTQSRDRLCRHILCGFLIFSVVIIVMAAVGVTVFRTLPF